MWTSWAAAGVDKLKSSSERGKYFSDHHSILRMLPPFKLVPILMKWISGKIRNPLLLFYRETKSALLVRCWCDSLRNFTFKETTYIATYICVCARVRFCNWKWKLGIPQKCRRAFKNPLKFYCRTFAKEFKIISICARVCVLIPV